MKTLFALFEVCREGLGVWNQRLRVGRLPAATFRALRRILYNYAPSPGIGFIFGVIQDPSRR